MVNAQADAQCGTCRRFACKARLGAAGFDATSSAIAKPEISTGHHHFRIWQQNLMTEHSRGPVHIGSVLDSIAEDPNVPAELRAALSTARGGRSLTISEQIRAAALGPTPPDAAWIYGWLGYTKAQGAVVRLSDWESPGMTKFTGATDTERRMFLLLCAEALESETA